MSGRREFTVVRLLGEEAGDRVLNGAARGRGFALGVWLLGKLH